MGRRRRATHLLSTVSRPSRGLDSSPEVPWDCRTAVGARLRLEPGPQPPTSAPDMPPLACPPGGSPLAERASRGVTGQGPRAHGPRRFPRDRSQRELYPNPIGSDTSCRDPAATTAGEAAAPGPHRDGSPREPVKTPGTSSPDELAFARSPPEALLARGSPGPIPMGAARAASPDSSRGPLPPVLRENDRDRLHPRCLPSTRSPACAPSPARRGQADAFFAPGWPRCLDVAAGSGGSVAPGPDR